MEYRTKLLWIILLSSLVTIFAQDRSENVASGKPVNTSWMTSTTQNAVDNLTRTCVYFPFRWFYRTSWLTINLGRQYPVYTVTLKGSALKDCVISVDKSVCYELLLSLDFYYITFNCTHGILNGSIINITRCENRTKICDVNVLSCRAPYWGSDCSNDCGQCNGSEVCDKVTGHCSSCPPGRQPPLCNQSCSQGYHGQNCTQQCNENCVNDSCDPVAGNCHCKPGFQESDCAKECSPGKYGPNCTQLCSKDCVDGSCDPVTGICPCESGFDKPYCIKDPTMEISPQPTSDMMKNEEKSGNVGVITGAAVGSAVLVTLVAIIIIIIRQKRSTCKGSPQVIYENTSDAVETRQQIGIQNQLSNGTTVTPQFTTSSDDEESVQNPDSLSYSPYESTYDKVQPYENISNSHVYSSL